MLWPQLSALKKYEFKTSGFDYAIATMDARGAFLDRLFGHDDVPNQDDIRAAAKAELDALRAKAAS